MAAEMDQYLTHGPEPVRAAIESVAALSGARLNTGFGQIVRVDELVGVFAVTEHWDVFPLIDPLEEDLKNSQPAVPHNRAWPDDRDIETFPPVFPA